jgi:hypothetical protein
MIDLINSKVKKTPQLILDENKGLIELKGSSIMEDTKAFYEPLMEWVYNYLNDPKDTTVNIDLDYFNTSSAKTLLVFFKTLSKIQNSGYRLTLNWYYAEDDEDIRDSGHNFSLMAKIPFVFIIKESQKDSL